jgi:hypothetical protein
LLASAHTWSAHVEQLRDLYTKLAAGPSDGVTTAAGPDRDQPTRLTTSFAGAKYRGLRLQRFPDAAVTAALAGHQAALARGGPAVLKRDHRARVTAVEAQGHRIVVKQVMKGGLRKRVADLFRGSPGRRAWVAGHGLLARGIPAATPLAFVERRRFGSVIESAVMLEDLRPAKAASQLDDLHEGDATALLCRLAIDLHSRAVRHGDLQASHIFVSGGQDGPRAALIDLEGVRFRRHLSQRSRIQALAELNASLADAALPPAERMRAFARYARALPFRMGNERALARIVELSLERKHRWRGTDCHLA